MPTESKMWVDYDAGYRQALTDPAFLEWRLAGARQKALNIMRVCCGVTVSSVIEIGCGTGDVLRQLHSMGFAAKYVASDVSTEAVEFTRRACSTFLKSAIVGSAGSLPFPPKHFSVAVLSHVIEHLHGPVAAVQEAALVANYVVIEVPTEKVLSNAIRTKILGKPFASMEAAGHVQFWSPPSIASFLEEECGMEILARHVDLLGRQVEFHGKRGMGLVKPLVKEVLKLVLPARVYIRLLTTHSIFLCRHGNRAVTHSEFRAAGQEHEVL